VPPPARPNGAVAVMFAITLPVMLGFLGLAIDLALVYMRHEELQQMADGSAMAAARMLDGTPAGIALAKSEVMGIASSFNYGGPYSGTSKSFAYGVNWDLRVLSFSSAPSGATWFQADDPIDAATAATLIYARVDTARLAELPANPGLVSTGLLRMVAGQEVLLAPAAIAGKTEMAVTPLGICALRTTKYASRPSTAGNELLEFGFRRGVSYDVLNLDPNSTAAKSFIVNPVDDMSVASPSASHFEHDVIKPFFCSGKIAYASLRAGGSVHVTSRASTAIHPWLNSRFGDYSGGDACTADGAPPDTNVREFVGANVTWMSTGLPAAKPLPAASPRMTVADPDPAPAGVVAADYGPLWVFNKPLKFVSSSAGGGSPFTISNWDVLYKTTSGPAMPKPTSTPAMPSAGAYQDSPYTKLVTAPTATFKIGRRRLLNLPLLDCSSAGATASVLGIGAFWMTSKATADSVYAEFAGLVSESTLIGNVRRQK
jgi:hypothetical protein